MFLPNRSVTVTGTSVMSTFTRMDGSPVLAAGRGRIFSSKKRGPWGSSKDWPWRAVKTRLTEESRITRVFGIAEPAREGLPRLIGDSEHSAARRNAGRCYTRWAVVLREVT